jgi:hypothetical protein
MIDHFFISNRLETLSIVFPYLLDYVDDEELVPAHEESRRNNLRAAFLKLSLCIFISIFALLLCSSYTALCLEGASLVNLFFYVKYYLLESLFTYIHSLLKPSFFKMPSFWSLLLPDYL